MSTTAPALITDFRKTFPECTSTEAYEILNDVSKQIIRVYGIRRKEFNLALTKGQRMIDINEGIVRIDEARWVDKPAPNIYTVPGTPIEQTTEDTLATSGADWRGLPPGTPLEYFTAHDLTTGEIGLDRPPDTSTLTVSGATNATPIVVTSSAAHGLADGQRVDILDVGGNTAANGTWYAKVTGYSATTFGLYSDEELTTAVAGNGAYTSGGLVSCAGSPYLKLYTRHHETLDSGSTMPLTPFYRDLYAHGMRSMYAQRHLDRHEAKVPAYRILFDDVLAKQFEIAQKRGGRKEPRVRMVQQRPGGYVVNTRW